MIVPNLLKNFRVYKDGNDLLGIADVTMPTLEMMTETIKGAGIAGEIEVPVAGHLANMDVTFNWRTLNKTNVMMFAPDGAGYDLRGDIQEYDSGKGVLITKKAKVVLRGLPKSFALGKLDAASAMDTNNVLDASYIKVTIDDEDLLEIDKYNYICKIGGTDYLAKSREALGLV